MDEAAENRPTPDPAVNQLGDRRLRARWTQLQRSMWPLRVVARRVLGEHPAEVSLTEDQHPVGDFVAATDGD